MAAAVTSPTRAVVSSVPPTVAPDMTSSSRVLLLVGLPGSGKTTFASRLVEVGGWVRVSQDEVGGSRQAVERHFLRALESGNAVVVDRCNCTVQQRSWFIENARLVGASVGTVLFASPVSTCISRVNKRAYHPTLPPSSSVPGVVRAFLTTFEAPSAKEGVAFGRVVRTDSDTSRVLNDVL